MDKPEGQEMDAAMTVPDAPETPDVAATKEVHISPARRRRSSLVAMLDTNDVSFHPGTQLEFYSPPQQRQKWGDSQILPRTNWGDTFYDLFFVAGAYGVGNILLNDPNGRGLLYLVGTFFPLMDWWRGKTMYDSRFVIGDDIAHRCFEMMVFVFVATSILHIGTVDIMANPREHIDMFIFALMQTLHQVLRFAAYGEISLFAQGQKEILRKVGQRDAKVNMIPFALYLASTIVAGIEYFHNGRGSLSYDSSSSASDYASNETAHSDDDHRRMLAGDESEASYVNDAPIILCVAAIVFGMAYFIIVIQFFFPSDGSHKNYTVPLNINFNIHRDGEWIMLMLGESILSLLIVDVTEADEYYATFFCGIVSVILFQYLHYRSLPHDADEHALRRDKNAAVWWYLVNSWYSAALICVGVSYKLFLYEFTFSARRLEEHFAERSLASGPSGLQNLDPEDRQQMVANLFSGAMATTFFCLDSMILLHNGLKNAVKRLECQKTKRRNVAGLVLTTCRVGLIAFFATLSQYENDPNHLSGLGMAGVMAQLLIRRLGQIVFPRKAYEHILHPNMQDDDEGKDANDPELDKWPNTTHAAVEPVQRTESPNVVAEADMDGAEKA